MGFLPGVKALTAAVLGGIGSTPGAALGGVILGLVEALGAGYLPNGSAYKDAISFVLLVLLLYIRPQGLLGRPELNSAGRGSLLGGISEIGPRWIRAGFEQMDTMLARTSQGGAPLALALLAIAIALGVFIPSDYWLRILTTVLIYGMLASGLNVIVGFTGLLDLGFVAFWAVGSYLTSILFVLVLKDTFGIAPQEMWWLLYLNLPLGGLIAACLAVLLGTPTLAAARRLSRHHDARLRRDRAHRRHQLDRPHPRADGHSRHPGADAVRLLARHAAHAVLLRAGARRGGAVRDRPADPFLCRARLGGDPRG